MKKHKSINRRKFLKNSSMAIAGIGTFGRPFLQARLKENRNESVEVREYRTLGRTSFKVSDIGFGAAPLNEPALLEAAIDAGINYIDTASHYGSGGSERTIGDVLKKGAVDRKNLFITTKLNITMGLAVKEYQTKKIIKERFIKSLERMQTEYVDCLMIHMAPKLEQIKHEGYHEAIKELRAEGKVRFTGLSNHGKEHRLAGPIEDDMEKVVLAAAEDGRFDVVLFAYNFIQKDKGERILRACKEKNMGTTLMKTNPVKFNESIKNSFSRAEESGHDLSEEELKLGKDYEEFVSQAEEFKKKYSLTNSNQVRDAAIKFVLSNPDVHTVCLGPKNFDDLDAYLVLSGQKLEHQESAMLKDYDKTYGRLYCRHACGMCEPHCPHGVPVNTIMRYDHYFRAQAREKYAMTKYATLNASKADFCQNCKGDCQSACPYGVPIQVLLIEAHNVLTLGIPAVLPGKGIT